MVKEKLIIQLWLKNKTNRSVAKAEKMISLHQIYFWIKNHGYFQKN